MAKVKVKLRLLTTQLGPASTCRHIAIEDFNSGKTIGYLHEDDLFTENPDEPQLNRSIKVITARLITKTFLEAKLSCDGKDFEDGRS